MITVKRESKIITGHVLDVSRAPLVAALKRYDEQLYLKWRPSKSDQPGHWELRRKPELKVATCGYSLDTPKGKVGITGDIFDMGDYTLVVPKYHETRHDVVKTFDRLGYHILSWVAKQDLWKYGYKGKNFESETTYNLAKYEERIDEESYAEKAYGLGQMKTQINDFRNYVLGGGNPYRLIDFWK